jgi:hypothetical protein
VIPKNKLKNIHIKTTLNFNFLEKILGDRIYAPILAKEGLKT